MSNLFAKLTAPRLTESLCVLAQGQNVRVERIVSMRHASPEGFWYDQAEREWVVVLLGEAILQFEGEGESLRLGPGDYVDIPAHRRHRVEWTSPDGPTVWLAVFYEAVSPSHRDDPAP